MGLLHVKVDVDEAMRYVQALQDDQLPYILARSLTAVAQEGQKSARVLVGQVFKQRNDWTVRNIKITPATKQTQTAEVFTDTGNKTTGAPDYLPRQEDGGEKVPVGNREHLAIPTKYLRQLAGGENRPIPDWLRPAALLKYADDLSYVSRRGKVRAQPKAIRGMYFFKVQLKTGGWAILTRAIADIRENAYPLYLLVTRAHLGKRFPMEQTVEETVVREFPQIFETIARDVGVSLKLGSY